VVQHVDAAELRVVVAAVLAVAADAVLVAKHLLKLGAHLVTALARLHVHNLARRINLEAGRMREKKGGEERRNVRNSRNERRFFGATHVHVFTHPGNWLEAGRNDPPPKKK
jgi:hypothetical protein